jgi:hypothetical protein
MVEQHVELVASSMAEDGGKAHPIDFVMWAAAQRSVNLIDGFAGLVEQGNHTCAVPLLRLQLDNAMRFLSLGLVKDPGEIVLALLSDKPLHKLKSRTGHQLRDRFLLDELSKHYPWAKSAYAKTSGWVHLSVPGMVSSFGAIDETTRRADVHIGIGAGRPWPEADREEAVDAFIAATDVVLALFASWTKHKRAIGKASGS